MHLHFPLDEKSVGGFSAMSCSACGLKCADQHSRRSHQRRPSSNNFDQTPSYLVIADSLSSPAEMVPTLQGGPEPFTNWRRAITSYLLRKGAHTTLEGTVVTVLNQL